MPNPARLTACTSLLALAFLAPMSHAQTPYSPKQVTASDYARAESMLGHKLAPLIDGATQSIRWQDGDRVLWVESRDGKSRLMAFDAAKRQPLDIGDTAALARALSEASDKPVDADTFVARLRNLRLTDDGLGFSLGSDDYTCQRMGACTKLAAKAAQ